MSPLDLNLDSKQQVCSSKRKKIDRIIPQPKRSRMITSTREPGQEWELVQLAQVSKQLTHVVLHTHK
jgi:hypothetical protein